MPTPFIKIVPYNRVRNNLRRLASKRPDVATPVFEKWGAGTAKVLVDKPYPAGRGGYIRTFELKRSWAWSFQGVNLIIKNLADYSGWVVKMGKQAWMHVGRWWTAEEVIEGNMDALRDALRREYAAVWTNQ